MSDGDLIRAHTLDQRRRGLAETTIDHRTRIVRHLSDWIGARGVLSATQDDIERFLDGRKLAAKSRYVYISNLHVFFDWAVVAGHIDTDPTARIVRPKVRPGLPRPISDADLEIALNMAVGDIKVIVSLAAYEGMRCIEIARLRREDVLDDRDPPLLVARGKGDRPRVIPLHEKAWEALRLLPMPRSGPVLHWGDGTPLPAWKVSELGNEYLHAIGIDETMHQLRHWFGTNLYRSSNRDLLLVRDLMGHSSVTTTTVYAAYDREGAVDAVSQLAPSPAGRSPTVRSVRSLRGAGGPGALSPEAPDSTERDGQPPTS